jgi:transposase-like protein
MSGLKPKTGPKQEAAVLALLSSKNVEDAARVAGITPRTLYRWMKLPEFDAAYRAARRNAYGQSISRLQQGSTAAATTLLKVMVDPATPPSTRVRAAEAVLSHAAKAIEIEDIDARLRELEAAAKANKGGSADDKATASSREARSSAH